MDIGVWIAMVVVVLAAAAYVAAARRRGSVRDRSQAPIGTDVDVGTRQQVAREGSTGEDRTAKHAMRAGCQAQVGGSDVVGRTPDLEDERRQTEEPR